MSTDTSTGSGGPTPAGSVIPARVVGVFVHGILSGPRAWDQLIALVSPSVEWAALVRFEYESPWIGFNPTVRVPDLDDLASRLDTFLKTNPQVARAERIVMIGHSQGGLVIQQFIASKLRTGRATELVRVASCLLFATPTNGSEFLMSVRSWLGRWLSVRNQEKTLRPLDRDIGELQRTIVSQAVYATALTPSSCPIEFAAFAGESDNIVHGHSAHWVFPTVGTLPGDHSSIICPTDATAEICAIVRAALLRGLEPATMDSTVISTRQVAIHDHELLSDFVRVEKEYFGIDLAVTREDMVHWLENYERQFGIKVRLIVGLAGGKPRGFLMFHEDRQRNIIVIDYFATRTRMETMGASAGGRATNPGIEARASQHEALIDQLVSYKLAERLRELALRSNIPRVIFEVEAPIAGSANEGECKARIRMFRRLGARVIEGPHYLAPSMARPGQQDQEVPCHIMYVLLGPMPPSVSRSEVEDIIDYLYRVWYGNWMSFRHKDSQTYVDDYLRKLSTRVIGCLPPGKSSFDLS